MFLKNESYLAAALNKRLWLFHFELLCSKKKRLEELIEVVKNGNFSNQKPLNIN